MGKGKKKKTLWQKIKENVDVIGLALTIITVVTIPTTIFLNNISHSISSINAQLNGLNSKVDAIYNDIYLDGGIKDQLGDIKNDLYTPVINANDKAMLSTLESISIKYKDIDYVAKSLSSDMIIGIDITGEIRYAKEFVNETILITYKEKNKDVYFLGQYNEEYHWDGLCITNAYYSDETLYGICESNFNNGKRLDYKSICASDTVENKWIFSEKICKKDKNEGINAEYMFEYNEIKNFTNETILTTDIFKVDKFLNSIDYTTTQYYCGDTSNELYNDTTGNAYMVKYDNDGNVILLYCGNFVNGIFEDTTGNAWDIAYSDEFDHYVYNIGKFKNNEYVLNSGKSTVVSIEQIREIISNYDFDCDLGNLEVAPMI